MQSFPLAGIRKAAHLDAIDLRSWVICVATCGLALILIVAGRLQLALVLGSVLLFVSLTFAARNVVRKAVVAALLLLPFTAAVNALHPELYNYSAYCSLALCAFTGAELASRRRPPSIDIGVVFLALVLVNAMVFLAVTPSGPGYHPLVYPLAALAFYLLVTNTPLAKTRDLLLVGIIVLGVVQALIGLSQSLFGHPFFSMLTPVQFVSDRNYLAYLIPGLSSTVKQGTGTFAHFNALGAFLAMALCVAFGSWLAQRTLWRSLALVAISAGLWTTYSRGSR